MGSFTASLMDGTTRDGSPSFRTWINLTQRREFHDRPSIARGGYPAYPSDRRKAPIPICQFCAFRDIIALTDQRRGAPSMIRRVVVFGGTGFLGRRVVEHLAQHGFAVSVASRHPGQARAMFADLSPAPEAIGADISDDTSIRRAIEGAYGVV